MNITNEQVRILYSREVPKEQRSHLDGLAQQGLVNNLVKRGDCLTYALTPAGEALKVSLVVWVQKWEESERGWGTRPDGFTIHREKGHIDLYLKRMREQEAVYYKGAVPNEYSRPCGTPYQALITNVDAIRRLIEDKLKGNVGFPFPPYSPYPPPLEPGADMTGWILQGFPDTK